MKFKEKLRVLANKLDKKHIAIIAIILVLGLLITFVSTNYNSIRFGNSIKKVDFDNMTYDGFKLKGNKLVSTSENPKFQIDDSGYIKKVRFNYHGLKNGNLGTLIEYENKSKFTNNSLLTDLFVENIDKYTGAISFQFNQALVVDNIEIDNSYSFNCGLYITIVAISLIIAFYIWNKEYFSKNVHKLFLLIAIPIGLTIIFVTSPVIGAGGDDDYHFGVTYQMLRLHSRQIWQENAVLSRNGYVNFLLFNTKEEISDGVHKINDMTNPKRTDRSFPITFSTITYIPASLVMNVSLAMGTPFSTTVVLAKLVNLFIYVVVMYYAIKIIPKYKYLMAFIGLLPTCLYVACQFSYDSKVTAFLMLMLALIIREILGKNKKISNKTILLIVLSGLIGASAKGIYILLILFAFAIPKEKFESKKKMLWFRAIIVFTVVFTFLTFMGSSLGSSDTRLNETASAPGQIQNIIHHPQTLVKAYYNSAIKEFLPKMFGVTTLDSMAYYGTPKSSNVYYISLITLLFVAFVDISGVALTRKAKVIILSSSALLICLIWGALYLSYTSVGADHIDGVQGRYFILLLLPLFMCLSTKKKIVNLFESTISNLIVGAVTFIFSISIIENIIIPYF